MKTGAYTYLSEESALVWHQIIREREAFFKKYESCIFQPYLDGYRKLALDANQVLTPELLAERLPRGWEPVIVTGYVPVRDYLAYIAKKQVPISAFMRSLEQIHYSPQPDFIHDVLGHIPPLFHPEYADLLLTLANNFLSAAPEESDVQLLSAQKEVSRLGAHENKNCSEFDHAVKVLETAERAMHENPSPRHLLYKFYLWTIEFGLMQTEEGPKLYGAGILSSTLEAEAVCQGKVPRRPFLWKELMSNFYFSDFQQQVFIADSIASLRGDLDRFMESIKQVA